jgi:predicted N-formylglutamate amidohydrolase
MAHSILIENITEFFVLVNNYHFFVDRIPKVHDPNWSGGKMAPDQEVLLAHPPQTVNPLGASSVILVCEHASSFIPEQFENLGLTPELRTSHVAWDPGAMGVALRLSETLDAVLVAGTVSRLVYDCNRPPSAHDAMPARSEVIDIPGNVGLTLSERVERTAAFYEPFRTALAARVAGTDQPIIVTIHSFTPVFHDKPRDVEIGVLCDSDARLAEAMLANAAHHTTANVQLNEPYGPEDGVTHTLKEHAIPNGHMNVMLEIRNDLIQTDDQQQAMADTVAAWLVDAFADTKAKGTVQCVA